MKSLRFFLFLLGISIGFFIKDLQFHSSFLIGIDAILIYYIVHVIKRIK